MATPSLTVAVTWKKFETAVLAVFREALRRLAQISPLPRTEEPINLELYWLLRRVHLEMMRDNSHGILQFSILFDCASQPEPDDAARSQRLRKRPDFSCVIVNPQAMDHLTSQANYYIECKRLGRPEGTWALSENYSEHGITRFVHADWQYAKAYGSATMVGYVQNSNPADILREVNAAAEDRGLPFLEFASAGWMAQDVNLLRQATLTRPFIPTSFKLEHLWIDLCHCTFVDATGGPPVSAAMPTSAIKGRPTSERA